MKTVKWVKMLATALFVSLSFISTVYQVSARADDAVGHLRITGTANGNNIITPNTVTMEYSIEYHEGKGWKVDGPFGECHIFGEICSLGKIRGHNTDSSLAFVSSNFPRLIPGTPHSIH